VYCVLCSVVGKVYLPRLHVGCKLRYCLLQDSALTGLQHAANASAAGFSIPSGKARCRHDSEDMPLTQRLEAIKAKLAASKPPAAPFDTVTGFNLSPASQTHSAALSHKATDPLPSPAPSGPTPVLAMSNQPQAEARIVTMSPAQALSPLRSPGQDKLEAPNLPIAAASKTATLFNFSPASHQSQKEQFMASISPAWMLSPVPSSKAAQISTPVKKIRRLVPCLPIAIVGDAEEGISKAGMQDKISATEQPKAPSAAVRADPKSVFSFL